MRLYWPKTEPPSILPPGEGTWQPPAIRRADAHSDRGDSHDVRVYRTDDARGLACGLPSGGHVVVLRARTACATNTCGTTACAIRACATRGAWRRRRCPVQARREHAPDAFHRDLPRRARGRDGEHGRRLLQHHVHVQRDPRVERHRPAGAGRGPRFREDEAGIRRPWRVVERPQTLAVGLDRYRCRQGTGVQRHSGRVGGPAEHGQQHQRR